jgi:hypothetical protein
VVRGLRPVMDGRAPSPVQAERSSAAARGHSDSGFAVGTSIQRWKPQIYFDNAPSSENPPAPRNNSTPAMASASRWNSIPSPFWLPIQFMKNPFGR